MKKVLFVCLGNICRSPMAEAIFNQKIKEKGLDHAWKADSAGTGAYHIGEQPDPRTLDTLEKHNIHFKHAARQSISRDATDFDFVLAMDESNYNNLKKLFPPNVNNLYLMRDFDDQAPGADVPDPYFGGQDGFENVYQMLDRSIDRFLEVHG